MAWAEVATAKAKARAMNLIIVFSMLSLRGEETPNRYTRLDVERVSFAPAPGGKTGAYTPHLRQTGGTPMKTMWAVIKQTNIPRPRSLIHIKSGPPGVAAKIPDEKKAPCVARSKLTRVARQESTECIDARHATRPSARERRGPRARRA